MFTTSSTQGMDNRVLRQFENQTSKFSKLWNIVLGEFNGKQNIHKKYRLSRSPCLSLT